MNPTAPTQKPQLPTPHPTTPRAQQRFARQNYELCITNYALINATILDSKTGIDTNNNNVVDYYQPNITTHTDYYPFGYPIAERSAHLSDYRYGFNGQESDGEVYGEKESYTAQFWQYDSRLGRRWNVDPVFKEYESPYACFAGNPVWFVDVKGDTIKTSQEGFDIINEGLTAVLGENHGFNYDALKGIVTYSPPEDGTYTADQQDVINRYVTLINSHKKTNIYIVDHNEKIGLINKSLEDMDYNASTVTLKHFSGFSVFIARDPQEAGVVCNPKFNPLRPDDEPAEIPGYVPTAVFYRGVASLHEIGGHAYLRLTQPMLINSDHNKLVEDFETNFRQFFQIGTYDKKREIKRANRNGLKVKLGNPKYLGGKADKHP